MLHTVALHQQYASDNGAWLRHFVFHIDGFDQPFFHCYSYVATAIGMVQFEVMLKSNAGKATVLLPAHAVVAILHDEGQKSRLGFLPPE